MPARIGIDTGGTFTDVVRWSRQGLTVHKLPSTPRDPGLAVLQGLAAVRATPDEPVDVVHGTTVGLNAVLTGSTARTALLTNAGFEDLIEIGRQERRELYALTPSRAVVPVGRELRLGVPCRRGPGGEVLQALTRQAIDAAVLKLKRLRPQAVAIGLLHAPADDADEQRLAAAVRVALPGIPVTCSSELWPGVGEFERFTAAVLNAGTAPLVSAYVARLARGLGPGQLRLMRSSLGIMATDEVAAFPARSMFSGPAGGVLATAQLAKARGIRSAAAFDMGGTSTDVCLVRTGELLTDQGRIAGLPLPLPGVDVHTVGCGGGSIAFVDRGGALRVGPHSAGADPGPACYGLGDDATVTDAHLVLGHLGADTLLGGAFPIDVDAAVRAIERLARRLALPLARTAEGILEIADAHMARALMVITVERAIDPAQVPLVAYGGAGGLHACRLMQRLTMPRAVIPAHPGAFSAIGLCLAGESRETLVSLQWTLDANSERIVHTEARRLGADLLRALGAPGRTSASVLLRYRGQGGGLRIPIGSSTRLQGAFARLHRTRFGFVSPDTPVEIVELHVRVDGKMRPLPAERRRSSGLAPVRWRRAPGSSGRLAVHAREELGTDSVLRGPCVVEELTGTTWVPAGVELRKTAYGLEMTPK